ncbi:MAG: hypothetical protein OIN66_14805 [Candidatus Methanoperedens sp.]|nr:hypothetical protein [Candidatus Methanoperedens sp.]
MKSLILVLFTVLVLTAILTEGKTERQSPHITSLTIKFDRTDAVFTVDYDIDNLPKMYLLLIGSKSLEPKIKSIFSNFDYRIIKMDQNRAILSVKNISRLDKGYYLYDSHMRFGEGIDAIYVYTPDSPNRKEYSNPYLFSWDNVPGNESLKLLTFLKEDLNIDVANNTKLLKLDKGMTISITTEDGTADVTLDKNKKKALLNINGVKAYELQVKEDSGRLDIYSPYMYSIPNIFYRS